jgi:hypothetical protein
MRVYLAGPMRGVSEFNFPAFMAAAVFLRAQGHMVFNPAERDNEKYGTDISVGNLTGSEVVAKETYGFSLREALGADAVWICREAEAIALLPGWEKSKGAKAELALSEALGLVVMYIDPSVLVA